MPFRESVVAEELGTCPFCGGDIAASLRPGGGHDGVLHSMPMCERFKSEEPDVFLKSVSAARAARRPS